MLNAWKRLSFVVYQAAGSLFEKRAREHLQECVAAAGKVVLFDRLVNSTVNFCLMLLRQFCQRISNRRGFQPCNMNIYEMRVETAGPLSFACQAVFGLALVVTFYGLLENGSECAQFCEGLLFAEKFHRFARVVRSCCFMLANVDSLHAAFLRRFPIMG